MCRNILDVNWYFLWLLFKTKKMFIFGLCFILYFLKLSGTNGCMVSLSKKENKKIMTYFAVFIERF